ncbi:MAG: polyketide synthase dehydratase domain-containing protein, partial [Gemmatimonadetes bacterium]|nr:polyketide synthase dehydratase domain-containing protein [Gemmatimonadota bacterium]
EAAVVLAGGSWGAQPAVAVPVERIARPTAGAYPLLAHATEVRRNGGTIEAIRTLDLAFDRYLDDHRLDNKPVLPLTAAMELMAELAQLGWPDLQVSGMRDIQLLKGVILESSTRTIRVAARALADPPSDRTGADVQVEITGADDASRVHYRATVELSSQIPAPESYSGDLEQRIAPFPLNVAEAYARWLFHGPAFQCVDRIEGFADEGIVTLLRPSRAAACLGAAVQGEWLLDPVLLDGALQSLLLWARGRHGLTALPTRIRRYRRFPRQGSGPVRTYVLARLLPDQHTIHATLLLIDEDQRVRHIIEGGEFVGSTALNRLAGQAAPAAASAAAVNAASVVSLAPISEEA